MLEIIHKISGLMSGVSLNFFTSSRLNIHRVKYGSGALTTMALSNYDFVQLKNWVIVRKTLYTSIETIRKKVPGERIDA